MNNIITIITPSLNQGQFIEETINSVLSQEGDFFIDYIIADGGSTDNSIDIIKKYSELLKKNKYPIKCRGIEYHWWSRHDKGQSDAINQCFKIAKGDIIAWINSDDYYEPRTFSIIMEEFKKNPTIDLMHGNGYKLYTNGKKKEIKEREIKNFEELLRRNIYIFQPSVFFTKNIIKKVGLLDENLHYAMDMDLWLKILKNGHIMHINKFLSNFRVWEEAKSVYRNQSKFAKERKKIFKKYGGNIIDPVIIERIIKNKFSRQLNEFSPTLFKFYKNTVYYFTDIFHH